MHAKERASSFVFIATAPKNEVGDRALRCESAQSHGHRVSSRTRLAQIELHSSSSRGEFCGVFFFLFQVIH